MKPKSCPASWNLNTITLCLGVGIAVAVCKPSANAATNTPDFNTGAATSQITTTTNWSLGTVPTVTNDAVFGISSTTGIRKFDSGTVTFASLDVLNAATNSIRNDNTSAVISTLTLGGVGNLGNSISGANSNDLIYVVTGGTLNLTKSSSLGSMNIVLGQDGNLNLKGTAVSTITSDISGAFALSKLGTGSLTLQGVNTFRSLVIGGGTVIIGSGGSLASETNVTFNAGGGTLNINKGATSSQTLGTVSSLSGETNLQSTFTGTSANLTLTLGTRFTGATRAFTLSGGAAGTPGAPGSLGTNNIIMTGQATGFIDAGTFYGSSTTQPGSNYAWYDSGGFVRGINYSVDAGSTTQAGGATIASTNYAQTTAAITAQTTATFTTLNIVNTTNVAQAFTLGAGQTVTTNGILRSGNGGTVGATTISGGTGIQGGLNQELVLRADAANDTLNISSTILANGANTVTKSGLGLVNIATNANNYTGGTAVNAGTLRFTATSSLGTGTSVTPFGTGPIKLNGGTLQLFANGNLNNGTGAGNNSLFEVTQLASSLIMGGNATLNIDRNGSGGNKTFQFNSLDLGANTLTTTNGNGFDLSIAGITKGLNGAAISNTNGASNNGLGAVNLNTLTVSDAAPTASTSIISLSNSNANVPINIYGLVTNNATDATKVLGLVYKNNNTTATNTNVLNLFGNNTFTGGLTATSAGGVALVRLYNTGALGTGNTTLNGAVLQGTRDYTSFTQTLGTGAGQINFNGGAANIGTNVGSGFAAYGANVTVNLNSGAGLVWNSTTGFNLGTGNLILNSIDLAGNGGASTTGSTAGGLGTLTFQNALDLNGTTTRVIETQGGTANISGNITNSGGTAQLTKAGGNIGNSGIAYGNASVGTLVLSGTNNFNGQINITGGLLSFATQANLGTGNIAFGGGGLQYTGAGALTLTNTFSTGNNNLGFDITNATGSLNVASNLSPGGNSFFKFGAGTLNYSGNNFNTVNFFVGGTTQLVNATNGTINVTTPAPSGNVATNLQITNGTANFNPTGSATPLFNFSGALTFNRAATIGLNKGTNTTETLNFATNNFTRNATGSTLTFAPNGGFATFGTTERVTVGTTPTLNSNAATVGTLNPSIIVRDTSVNNLDADFVSIATAGTTLFNANSASATAVSKDTTSANGATFNTANPGVMKLEYVNAGVSVSAQTTATVGALVNAGSIAITSGNTLTIGSNTANHQSGLILNNGTISGGTVAFGLNEGVIAFNSQATNAISSVITGTAGLTFNGATGGTITIGSATANTYTGTTTINGGTVKLAATSTTALGTGTTLTINSGTLDLNGNSTVALASLNGTSLATITNTSGTAATLNLGVASTLGSVFSGAITGSNLAVTKGASGSLLLLDGANTYGGITTINNGGINFGSNLAGLSANSNLLIGNTATNTNSYIMGNGTFSRALGTAAGQVRFVATNNAADNVGFAAYGGPLTVNIGGAGATLVWNTGGTSPTGGTANWLSNGNLFFGSALSAGNGFGQSDNKVTFVNGLDINGGNRIVTVNTVNYNTTSGFNTGQYGLDSALISGNLTNAGPSASATLNTNSFTKTGNISSSLLQLSGTASNLGFAKFNAGTGVTQFLSGASLTTKGSLNITDKVIVDNGATVTFGGDNTAANINYVGNNSTAQNTLQIDGGTVNINNSDTGGVSSGNGWLFGGANSATTNGAINLTAGTLNVGTFLALASTPSGTAGAAPAGNNSTFALNIDAGTVNIGGGTGSVGAGVNGALYLKGDSSSVTATGGQAIVNLNGGTLSLTQIIMGGAAGSQSVVNFNGGTLQAKGAGQTYASFITAPGTTNNQFVVQSGGAIFDTNSNNITVAAPLLAGVNDGGLTKKGAGSMTLTGMNSYKGNTVVNVGNLSLSGSGSVADSALIDVKALATLDVTAVTGGAWTVGATQSLIGAGTITGSTTNTQGVFISGTHSAGNGVGTQTVNADLTYNTDSIFSWDLSVASSNAGVTSQDALVGTAYDGATVNGDLSGTGAVFKIVLGAGETFANPFWSSNRTWANIFTTGNATWASIFPTFQYSVTAPNGVTQGSFTLTGGNTLTWSAVPEPTTALAGVLLGAGLLRRRRSGSQVTNR